MYIELNMDRSGQDFLNCISIVSHKCLILITTKAFAPFIASAIRKTYQREILIQERRLDYWYGSCGGGISGGPLKPQKTWFWTFWHKWVYLEKQLPFFWWKFPWPWSCWWASLGTAVIFGVDGFCWIPLLQTIIWIKLGQTLHISHKLGKEMLFMCLTILNYLDYKLKNEKTIYPKLKPSTFYVSIFKFFVSIFVQ